MVPQNLGLLFQDTAGRFPDKKAFLFKRNGEYLSLTWKRFEKKVRAAAWALSQKGLKKGDRIAILSENRPEWALMDLAAQCLGAVTVPLYTTLTPAEIQYLLVDSGASMVAVSNRPLFEKLSAIQRSLPELKLVIAFDSSLALSRQELGIPLILLKELEETVPDESSLDASLQSISGESLASIIYTSGTTGKPKGVMLTHQNFIQNVLRCKETLRMGPSDVHISFLPLCHVFERTAGYYLMVHIGATIGYAENLDTVAQDLLMIRPTFILGVPRFFEKIREHALETLEKASPFKRAIFLWAKELGVYRRKAMSGGCRPGLLFGWAYFVAKGLVYRKFKNHLGGRIRFCVAGGAPLSREVAEFFLDLGVMIYEGYGLTETSPVISVNREEKWRFGTVGIPLDDIEVKISEEGEIITKSVCVMKGYYKRPEETSEALKEGWFYTGDLGKIDEEGFLSITGRKKELIVTSGGKKVAPRPIEALIEADPFIRRCMLFGEGRKFITAFIVPNEEKLTEYAKSHKIAFMKYEELLNDSKTYEFLDQRVQEHCRDLANFEKIKYFALLGQDFSQAAGELTPTLKVKREVVAARYQDRLLPYYEKQTT